MKKYFDYFSANDGAGKAGGSPIAREADGSANENLTELVFIVDRSGSMGGMEADTIGGVNSVLAKNAEAEGDTVVSVVLFDHETEVLIDRKLISKVKPLTKEDYWVRGCTALLDALGGSVKFIDRVHRYLPADAKPSKTIFVVTTDGLENASHEFSYDMVKKLIEAKQNEGWEFLFLGANIDAVEEAGRLGIPVDRAATYLNDSDGAEIMYDAVAEATYCMRACSDEAGGSKALGAGWKRSIESDTRRRSLGNC